MKNLLAIIGLFGSLSHAWACMPPDTLILMASGELVPIHKIHAGREVKAFDPKIGQDVDDVVRTQVMWDIGSMYRIEISFPDHDGQNEVLFLTGAHYFVNKKKPGWESVSKTKVGDELRCFGNKTGTVVSIDEADYSGQVEKLPWKDEDEFEKDFYTYNLSIRNLPGYFIKRIGPHPVLVAERTDLFGYYERRRAESGRNGVGTRSPHTTGRTGP